MPTNIVDVDLQSETGAITRETYSDLVVVAREPSTADPDYNEPRVYDSSAQVSADFGSDSDAFEASQEIEARGADQWWVVMLDTTSHSETLGNSDTEQADEGTVSNTPIRGGLDNITITLDGEEQTPVPSASSPPAKPDPGEAAFNADTGEVVTGESSSGSAQGIQVEYESPSFDAAFPEMTPLRFDLAVLADTRADRSYIGELDTLHQWCDTENVSMVVAYEDGRKYESDEAAMEAAHDIGGYIQSGRVLPIAHKSSDDVASGIAGRLATQVAWFNPYMDGGADYSFELEQYRRSLIGGPDQPGTFEGGDNDQAGPANVLHTEMGVQILSNSLSTAGEASNYQFFDVARTEDFIKREMENALRSLRLRNDNIPFAPIGRTIIESALRKNLNPYVANEGRALSQDEIQRLRSNDSSVPIRQQRASNTEANVPLSELEIHVPEYDDLTQTNRANRVWDGIQVSCQLAGNAHTFSVDLAVRV